MLAEALEQFTEQLREMIERMIKGEAAELRAGAGTARTDGRAEPGRRPAPAGVDGAAHGCKRLKFQEVQEALEKLQELLAQMGMNKQRLDQMRQILQANQQAMQEQVRQLRGAARSPRTWRSNGRKTTRRTAEPALQRSHPTRTWISCARKCGGSRALLRSRVALRQKRAKTGQLDAKATIRANLKHGSVPIEIKHRDRHLEAQARRHLRHQHVDAPGPGADAQPDLRACRTRSVRRTHSPSSTGWNISRRTSRRRKPARPSATSCLRMPSGYYNTDLGDSLEEFMPRLSWTRGQPHDVHRGR